MPPDSRTLRARPSLTAAAAAAAATVTVAAMTQPEGECQRRFRAAVDVIQSLPKNGAYRPSYEVMLRFYSLYKQAVFGPCRSSRPGFWDPVGRYKWDAWSHLGDMSSEDAMTEYVEEMKKVAQEVIDSMPVNKKTASLFHYFEPLYLVIHDMPRPPEALLNLRAELEARTQTADSTQAESEVKMERDLEQAVEEEATCGQDVSSRLSRDRQDSPAKATSSAVEPVPPEGLVGMSDSESEVFCDSLEQLDRKSAVSWSDTFRRELEDAEHYSELVKHSAAISQATQVGAGQGGEGAGEEWAPPIRGRGFRLEPRRGQREEARGRLQGSGRRARDGASGDGGGDGWKGRTARQQQAQMQQQIISILRQLREDMFSVMERLEAVERLAAAQAQGLDWRSTCDLAGPSSETLQESWRWPLSVSGRTALLLLLWPFVAHMLVFLLRRRHRKSNLASRGQR